ncbi:LOB domain-containing protein 27-like [Chenopodium quinoa]|uniref:LOB domain-containing protein 27-like n=1 Tax=Chenopodium quinoa TaxID=63459 RepID=UPI000B76D261|nr:LOB domain-containing protein 27-like [Chenopodium quinoa]
MPPFQIKHLLYLVIVGLLMTIKGGTSQACAACRFQRRKCAPDCLLAPYFPADNPKMFQCAHRLYGVCNITKILKKLDTKDLKDEAMKSIIYECEMRQRHPVYGCSFAMWQLNDRLSRLQEELYYVQSWLAILKNKEHSLGHGLVTVDPTHPSSIQPSQLQLDSAPNTSYNPHHQSSVDMYLAPNKFLVGDKDVAFAEPNEDVKPSLLLQQQQQQYGANNNYCVNSFSNNEMKQFMISQGIPLQQELDEISHNHYDDLPFDTIADDQQSYIESKGVCESSAESTMKDSIQSMETFSQNHELKTAAACFSLTSVN